MFLLALGLLPVVSGCAADVHGRVVLQSPLFPAIQGRTSDVTARLEIGGVVCVLTVEPDTTLSGSCPDVSLGTHAYTLTYRTVGGMVLATAAGTVNVTGGDSGPVAVTALITQYDDDANGCLNVDEFTARCTGFVPNLTVAVFPAIHNRTSEVTARLDVGAVGCQLTVEADTTLTGSCADLPVGTYSYILTYRSNTGLVLATASGDVVVRIGNSGPLAIAALNTEYDDDDNGCLNIDEFTGKCLSFAPKWDLTTGSQPQSVAIGDVNGDGRLDVVAANSADGTVSVMFGHGDGMFDPKTDVVTLLTQQRMVALADLNGDAALDMIVASQAMNIVSVLLGTGTGGFGVRSDYPTGNRPRFLAVKDLNADGFPDVVSANLSANSVSVLLGDGTGVLGARTDFTTGSGPRSVAIADLNGDAIPDLAVANVMDGTVSVLIGTGNGSFDPKVDYDTRERPRFVAIGDLNGDGHPDLATASESTSGVVSVLLGNSTGTFGSKTDYSVGSNPIAIAIVDLSGDGYPDLAVTSETGSIVSVLTGTGAGSFRAKRDFAAGTQPHSIAVGDFNGDGKPDLAVANFSSDSVSILLNTTRF